MNTSTIVANFKNSLCNWNIFQADTNKGVTNLGKLLTLRTQTHFTHLQRYSNPTANTNLIGYNNVRAETFVLLCTVFTFISPLIHTFSSLCYPMTLSWLLFMNLVLCQNLILQQHYFARSVNPSQEHHQLYLDI